MHEALIQIRANHELTEEQREVVRSITKRYATGGVEWEIFQPRSGRGLDVYISSLGVARRTASRIARSLNGKISESTKYLGMKDGKRRYRFHLRIRILMKNL